MTSPRLANDAWEGLFRAQVTLMRRFAADKVWDGVTQVEYDVLYTLSKSERDMSMVELNEGLLLTQGGVSKLIARLAGRGLVARTSDPTDGRVSRIALTPEGHRVQRRVGRLHGAAVTATMTAALDEADLIALRDLTRRLVEATDPTDPHDEEPT